MLRFLGQRCCASTGIRATVFGLAYLAGAELAEFLCFPGQALPTFWPPAGLLVGVLALHNPGSWPAYVTAAAVAQWTGDVLHGHGALVAFYFFLASVLQALLGAWLLRREVGPRLTLATLKETVGFGCLVALGPLLGATVHMTAAWLEGSTTSSWSVWQGWWCANTLGILLTAPLVFTWTAPSSVVADSHRWWPMEEVLLVAGLMVTTEAVYGAWLPPRLMLPMLVLPFLLWAVFRFGPRTATTALFLIAIVGVWNTAHGRGPYTILTTPPSDENLRVQGALSIIVTSVLLLAAVVTERRQTARERLALITQLHQALAEIKTLRGLIPICAWCHKVRDDSGYWQQLESFLRDNTHGELSHGICPECLVKQLDALKPQ